MSGLAAQGGPAAAGAAGPNAVPEGTMTDVLDWVGNDPVRAQAAYDAELVKEQPRTSLLPKLEALGAQA